MKLRVFCGLALGLFLLSCNIQQAEKYNSDFAGKWRSVVFFSPTVGDSSRNYLIIDGKDSALGVGCKKNCELCNCLVFQTGKAKINKSTMALQIGNSIQNIRRIDSEPYLNANNQWEMVVDSMIYEKY
jgi:hypothetical protein